METNKQFISYICSMVPYGLKVQYNGEIYELYGVANNEKVVIVKPLMSELMAVPFNEIKTYLRPMSSMMEEENKQYQTLTPIVEVVFEDDASRLIDWLNANHFDYRGLIEMNLAIEAPEGMYENEIKSI